MYEVTVLCNLIPSPTPLSFYHRHKLLLLGSAFMHMCKPDLSRRIKEKLDIITHSGSKSIKHLYCSAITSGHISIKVSVFYPIINSIIKTRSKGIIINQMYLPTLVFVWTLAHRWNWVQWVKYLGLVWRHYLPPLTAAVQMLVSMVIRSCHSMKIHSDCVMFDDKQLLHTNTVWID